MFTKIFAVLLILIRLNATKDILRLGVLVSQSKKGGLNLSGYLPAMQLAFESITNDTTLPFDFNVTVNDSMVSSHGSVSPWHTITIAVLTWADNKATAIRLSLLVFSSAYHTRVHMGGLSFMMILFMIYNGIIRKITVCFLA